MTTLRTYTLLDHTQVAWDDRLPTDHVVTRGGWDSWSKSCTIPADYETGGVRLNVHRPTAVKRGPYGLYPVGPLEEHPLGGGVYETVEAADRAAYDAGVLVLMRYDEPRPVPPCPCDCNSGGFCGGCGHAGCGGRR